MVCTYLQDGPTGVDTEKIRLTPFLLCSGSIYVCIFHLPVGIFDADLPPNIMEIMVLEIVHFCSHKGRSLLGIFCVAREVLFRLQGQTKRP